MLDDTALHVTSQVITLRSALEETLRAAIVSGRFRPGQRLPERELCELTGASRASVREALRQLEAEGLVVTRPHRGPSVASFTPAEAQELFGVRGVLLGYAARLCAAARPPEALEAVRQATTALETAAGVSDTRAIVAAGNTFHQAIADGSGNVVLQQMLLSVHNRLALLRNLSMSRPARVRDGIATYRAIRDALLDGDATRAEALCLRHNEAGASLALRLLADTHIESTTEKAANQP
jgi:DNA-binding GntR family transcriptional regulator